MSPPTTSRALALAFLAMAGACTAAQEEAMAPAIDAGGGAPDAEPPSGPDSAPAHEALCKGLPASMGYLGELKTKFGYYRTGGVNDIYRFGGMGTAEDMIDIMLVQNDPPFEDGNVDEGDYLLKVEGSLFEEGINVSIYPGTVFEGDLGPLTGVNPTFAAVSAEVSITQVSTTGAIATVENATFVEVDGYYEPVPDGCTTEIAFFSVGVPTFTD